jgi:hypothetical protein
MLEMVPERTAEQSTVVMYRLIHGLSGYVQVSSVCLPTGGIQQASMYTNW